MITKVLRYLKVPQKFTILNLIGLSIGFTILSLIALFVIREFSYDRFHSKTDSIYMIEVVVKNDDGTIDKGKHLTINQIDAFKKQLPGISNITFLNYSYFDWDNGAWIKYDNKEYQLFRMAFTNYINLSYAGSFRQQKELSVRRIFGASRTRLILSFLTGSVLICLFAFVLSLFIAEFPLQWFNLMIENPLYSKQLYQSGFILLLALGVIFTGLVSGIFPALAATRRVLFKD